eukprot:6906174-Alexandrium_andersonii.AAC.1
MELPRAAWPPRWQAWGLRCPALLLRKAIPGLEQSGELWHQLAKKVLRRHEWTLIADVCSD